MTMRAWILHDGRACGGVGTDDAVVVEFCGSEQESVERAREHGFQIACYSYAKEGRMLVDERWEFDTDQHGRRIT